MIFLTVERGTEEHVFLHEPVMETLWSLVDAASASSWC